MVPEPGLRHNIVGGGWAAAGRGGGTAAGWYLRRNPNPNPRRAPAVEALDENVELDTNDGDTGVSAGVDSGSGSGNPRRRRTGIGDEASEKALYETEETAELSNRDLPLEMGGTQAAWVHNVEFQRGTARGEARERWEDTGA